MILNPFSTLVMFLFISCQSYGLKKTIHQTSMQTNPPLSQTKVIVGAQRMSEYLPILQNKKVALVVNHTSLVNGVHLLDTLLAQKIKVTKVFAPEHGFRGDMSAGAIIKDQKDQKTGVPLISLYGKKKKPMPEDLANVEVVLFDIQDVGVRFFTYISTLHYVMEACAENGKQLILLDRPNPNAHYVDGPVLNMKYSSFVGMHPIPIVYGMTIGELAQMIQGEKWIGASNKLQMKIVNCLHYTHSDRVVLQDKPSPNLPNEKSILLYPSICLFEGTSVSLGRGTTAPFQIYGHPDFPVLDTSYTPIDIPGAKDPPHESLLCHAVSLQGISNEEVRSTGAIQLSYLLDSYKKLGKSNDFFLKNLFFDKLAGTEELRLQVKAGVKESDIRKSWQPKLKEFKQIRKKYLIYKD
ncbi:MAG: DUF1343 domain-containing protein [Saprospiraceae bacterium]|nr:DUF1343 domain-containing protein [Saprospiraceae bacterium]